MTKRSKRQHKKSRSRFELRKNSAGVLSAADFLSRDSCQIQMSSSIWLAENKKVVEAPMYLYLAQSVLHFGKKTYFAKKKWKSGVLAGSLFVSFFLFISPDLRDKFVLWIWSSCLLPPLQFAISTSETVRERGGGVRGHGEMYSWAADCKEGEIEARSPRVGTRREQVVVAVCLNI